MVKFSYEAQESIWRAGVATIMRARVIEIVGNPALMRSNYPIVSLTPSDIYDLQRRMNNGNRH